MSIVSIVHCANHPLIFLSIRHTMSRIATKYDVVFIKFIGQRIKRVCTANFLLSVDIKIICNKMWTLSMCMIKFARHDFI